MDWELSSTDHKSQQTSPVKLSRGASMEIFGVMSAMKSATKIRHLAVSGNKTVQFLLTKSANKRTP